MVNSLIISIKIDEFETQENGYDLMHIIKSLLNMNINCQVILNKTSEVMTFNNINTFFFHLAIDLKELKKLKKLKKKFLIMEGVELNINSHPKFKDLPDLCNLIQGDLNDSIYSLTLLLPVKYYPVRLGQPIVNLIIPYLIELEILTRIESESKSMILRNSDYIPDGSLDDFKILQYEQLQKLSRMVEDSFDEGLIQIQSIRDLTTVVETINKISNSIKGTGSEVGSSHDTNVNITLKSLETTMSDIIDIKAKEHLELNEGD
jgi:hypothetical protein